MRAGGFAEDRVIDLINRRFVPFYYCTGGPGLGQDTAAREFVADKTDNQYAFLAVFHPDGTILGESALYADKDATFDFLKRTLGAHPDHDRPTAEETEALVGKSAGGALAAARMHEELGNYDAAVRQYRALTESTTDASTHGAARLGLMRIHRYRDEWDEHARVEADLRTALAVVDGAAVSDTATAADADIEAGYRRIARREFAAAREILQARAHAESIAPAPSRRLAELHVQAGVACWMAGDRDWAALHFCWVVENLPDDRLARRAYICAAAHDMPYENAELFGFKARGNRCSTGQIVTAYRDSLATHRALLPRFLAGEFRGPPPVGEVLEVETESDPAKLARTLRDGNPHVKANNRVVARLAELGAIAMPAMRAAFQDAEFLGRGYVLWAMAKTMVATGERGSGDLALIRSGLEDEDRYVRALARSCIKILRDADAERTLGKAKKKPPHEVRR